MKNICIINSLLALGLYDLLIPKFGLIGLGIGLILSKGIINILAVYILYKKYRIFAFNS